MNLSKFITQKIFFRLLVLYALMLSSFILISIYDLHRETERFFSLSTGYIFSSTQQLINQGEELRTQMNIDEFTRDLNTGSDFKICPKVFLDKVRLAEIRCQSFFKKQKETTLLMNNNKWLRIEVLIDYDHFIWLIAVKIFLFSLFSLGAFVFIKRSIDQFAENITRPLKHWSEWARTLSFDQDLEPPAFSLNELHIDEFKNFNHFTNRAFEIQKNFYQLKINEEKMNARAMLAKQVSHDIRSPLMALEMALKESAQHNFMAPLKRIKDIANELLIDKTGVNELKIEDLSVLLTRVFEEKKWQYQKKKMSFSLECEPELFSFVEFSHFQRMISNLLNNAFEALKGEGEIKLQALSEEDKIIIKITDNGPGIKPEILSRLGEIHFSYGKESGPVKGSGLGLYHAKKMMESFSGELSIQSTFEVGTEVLLKLPRALKTKDKHYQCVYIDDDPALRKGWQRAADKKKIKLLVLSKTHEFFQYEDQIDKEHSLIFIDSDLAEEVKGEDFAGLLNKAGYKKLFMATGHEADHFAHLTWLKHNGKAPPF